MQTRRQQYFSVVFINALNFIKLFQKLIQDYIHQFQNMNQQAIKQCKSILKKNHLHPIRKLGKGAFATVFLVEKIQLQKNENQLYSAKCINKKQILKRPSLNKYIKQQIQILRNIEHENIVRSFRTFEDQGWIFMVMQYCDKGNLNTKVTESQSGVLSIDQTFFISYDIIKGLQYMHSKNLIHRDIKAENILLCSKRQKKSTKSRKNLLPSSSTSLSINAVFDYITKICDLGFTREQDEQVNTFCGTTCYMAPQIFQKSNYDYKVDIWALGVLIFYMLFGQFPFKSLNVQFQIEKKCSDGFKISNVNSIKANQTIIKQDLKILNQFFKRIFVVNPQERMSLQQLKSYPWFKKFNLTQKQLPLSTKMSQQLIPCQKLIQCKSSQKTTIQSDSSSTQGNSTNFLLENNLTKQANIINQTILNEQKNIQIQKYLFVKEIINEVEKQKFLKSSEEAAFKYYILKMLQCQFNKTLSQKIQYKKQLETLLLNLQKYTSLMNANISKISIPKFNSQNYNPKAKTFNDFKQPYRLVVGHVFAKAHKNITQDIHVRSQLKLKLFICHVINRVFNNEHNEGIFAHFQTFLKKLNIKENINLKQKAVKQSKDFNFKLFRKWIQTEDPQKLVQTIEFMNAKFYKGK